MSIKGARLRAGKSVRDTAKTLEISTAAVYQWESGVNRPDIEKLVPLARLFNCTVEELLADEPDAEDS